MTKTSLARGHIPHASLNLHNGVGRKFSHRNSLSVLYLMCIYQISLQEIVEGKGPEASEGDLVEINYVCRRSNGYFVHRSAFEVLFFSSDEFLMP